MEKDPLFWLSEAQYELDTAGDMLQAGRYRYTLFATHLALEKLLKALIAAHGDFPPRQHDLVFLAGVAGVTLDLDRGTFFSQLTKEAREARYPTKPTTFTRALARQRLAQGQETFQWLRQQLK